MKPGLRAVSEMMPPLHKMTGLYSQVIVQPTAPPYSQVRFCSDECRSEAWERFHKVECQQLNLILDAGVGKNAMLAMRILTSSGKGCGIQMIVDPYRYHSVISISDTLLIDFPCLTTCPLTSSI